jgi:hypothetical protein
MESLQFGTYDGPCKRCGHDPATVFWTGEQSAFEAARFKSAVPWCDRCAVLGQIEYAEKLAERLPGLREELKRIDKSRALEVTP